MYIPLTNFSEFNIFFYERTVFDLKPSSYPTVRLICQVSVANDGTCADCDEECGGTRDTMGTSNQTCIEIVQTREASWRTTFPRLQSLISCLCSRHQTRNQVYMSSTMCVRRHEQPCRHQSDVSTMYIVTNILVDINPTFLRCSKTQTALSTSNRRLHDVHRHEQSCQRQPSVSSMYIDTNSLVNINPTSPWQHRHEQPCRYQPDVSTTYVITNIGTCRHQPDVSTAYMQSWTYF